MTRTLNVEAHAVRRDTFVAAAQRLIAIKGYEQLSIQDLLDETGSSKGAFYHYFDSKESLLEAVVERITDTALAAVEPIALDPDKSAPERLVGMFSGIAGWKNARKDLMLAILKVWISDDNTVVRERFRTSLGARLGPLLTRIVADGKTEGTFDVVDPAITAELVLALITSANEAASRLFLACQKGAATIADARTLIAGYQQAIERVLGAPRGSLTYVNDDTLQLWFG
jgi:AcrR family transcriptional regulator